MDEAMQRLLHQPRGGLLLLLLLLLPIVLVIMQHGIIHTSFHCIESLRTLQVLGNLVRTDKQGVIEGTLLGVDGTATGSPAGTLLVQTCR